MDKNKITQNQYMFMVISAMLAVGVLSMASGLCKTAKQNGWISIIIGGVYPLFILITAAIIDRKSNHLSYWDISHKIYGKTLTIIFSIIFLAYFITLLSNVIANYADVLILSITSFLQHIDVILPTLIFITLISLAGIQIAGRICEFYFYITFPLLIITLFLFQNGSITNIKPIYISFDEIKSSIPVTFFAFSGCEISYFIISKVSNNKNLKKSAVLPCIFIVFVYALNVFMCIYNLGCRLTANLNYPLLYLIQSIEIPIISNFLSIVILLWSIIILKSILVYMYTSCHIIANISNLSYKKSHILLLCLVIFYSIFLIPKYNAQQIIDSVMPYFVAFSATWALITTILVSIKFRSCQK